ncbi:Hsp20/alpha crystallin family protein [Halobacterium litoreum]|uniref:Hsp20/alpha crystallin family protein n=1 Tax=Halobacterium litoreum TaxID=2039234 RepID=A0ABD5NAY5_9EURY|nr:Hsp20/alpha crystallin family protein [Halobacterium litoreum]UHH14647.1 Hsp20/alpha crystallin family protein [Halobacterium litoreum]
MARYSPFEELERIVDEMQTVFEEGTRRTGAGLAGIREAESTLDLVEYDDEYVVTVDLPGYDKADVDVRLDDRRLVVDAEHAEREETEDEEGRYIRRERRESASMQTVTFPQDVRAENVSARMQNGVLTVTVPKAEAATEGRHVDIE